MIICEHQIGKSRFHVVLSGLPSLSSENERRCALNITIEDVLLEIESNESFRWQSSNESLSKTFIRAFWWNRLVISFLSFSVRNHAHSDRRETRWPESDKIFIFRTGFRRFFGRGGVLIAISPCCTRIYARIIIIIMTTTTPFDIVIVIDSRDSALRRAVTNAFRRPVDGRRHSD